MSSRGSGGLSRVGDIIDRIMHVKSDLSMELMIIKIIVIL
jgi:hypothetical protein